MAEDETETALLRFVSERAILEFYLTLSLIIQSSQSQAEETLYSDDDLLDEGGLSTEPRIHMPDPTSPIIPPHISAPLPHRRD